MGAMAEEEKAGDPLVASVVVWGAAAALKGGKRAARREVVWMGVRKVVCWAASLEER